MKFVRFILPMTFLLVSSCACCHDDMDVPVNSAHLSNCPHTRAANRRAMEPSPRQEEARVTRIVVAHPRPASENIEYTEEAYVPPAPEPEPTPMPEPEPEPKPEPAPAPAPRQATVHPNLRRATPAEAQRSRITFLASIVYHQHAKADLSVRDRAAIAEVADFVIERDGRVKVIGHASAATRGLKPEAAARANFEVSRQRALTVRRELITNKVPPEHIRAFAASDRRPAVPEVSPETEAINRRTEIFVRF